MLAAHYVVFELYHGLMITSYSLDAHYVELKITW
jgi:hypothetical protein